MIVKIKVEPLSIKETEQILKNRKYKGKDVCFIGEFKVNDFGYILENEKKAILIHPILLKGM